MAVADDDDMVESHASSVFQKDNKVAAHKEEIEMMEGGIDKTPNYVINETPTKTKEGADIGPDTNAAEDYTTGKKLIPDEMLGSPSKKLEGDDLEALKREIAIKKEEFSAMGSLAEQSEFQGDAMSFSELINKEVDATDKCMCYCASVSAFLFGAALPMIFLIFAALIDDFGSQQGNSAALGDALKKKIDDARASGITYK